MIMFFPSLWINIVQDTMMSMFFDPLAWTPAARKALYQS